MSSGYTSPASMVAISVVLPVLAVISVSLRFHTRKRQKQQLLLDDWILIPAVIFTVTMGAVTIVGVHGHGIGYPTPLRAKGPGASQTPEATIAGKVEWINLWLQPLALGCIKISLLAFYSRIFGILRNDFFFVLIWILVGLTVAWILSFFFALFFMCGTTFSHLWGPYINLTKYCSSGHALWIDEALSISDFCFDVILFFLPLPKIWSLQMALKRRLLVSVIFLIGAFAIIGSILRMIVFIQVQEAIETKSTSVDGLILVSRFLFWSIFEAGIATIAVCLPTLQSLVRFDLSTIIHSVRSMISLQSLRSGHSGSGQQVYGPSVAFENESNSSRTKITRSSGSLERGQGFAVETYAMRDAEHMTRSPSGQIRVRNDIHLSTLNTSS